MILRGKAVVVYLQAPRERFWGILRGSDTSGVVVEGIEADAFESWARDVAREGDAAAPASVVFFPAGRIEKLLLDRSATGLPSLEERFRQIAGRSIGAHLGPGSTPRPLRTVPIHRGARKGPRPSRP